MTKKLKKHPNSFVYSQALSYYLQSQRFHKGAWRSKNAANKGLQRLD